MVVRSCVGGQNTFTTNSKLNEGNVRDYDIVNNAPPSGGRSEEGDGPSVE